MRRCADSGVGGWALVAVVVAGCGRIGFDDVPASGANPDAPPVHAVPGGTVVSSVGTLANAPGFPTQTHLVYAVGSATWWLFYLDGPATNTIYAAYTTDFVTWTEATSFTAKYPLRGGANFSVASKQIGGLDIVHVALAYTTGSAAAQHNHVRAVLSSGAIAWDAEVDLGCGGATVFADDDGPAVAIDSLDRVFDATSAYADLNCNPVYSGNIDITYSGSSDTGASWSPTWITPNYLQFVSPSGGNDSHWVAPLDNGTVLTVQSDGLTHDASGNLDNLLWASTNQTTTSAVDQVAATAFSTAVDANQWTAVCVSTTNCLVVVRTGAASFASFAFDGSAWSTAAAIPAQTTSTTSGPFLATDGTSVWLFVIDSSVSSTIHYTTLSSAGWAAWAAFESGTQTRSYLAGYNMVADGVISLMWVQANGTNYDLVVEPFLVEGG